MASREVGAAFGVLLLFPVVLGAQTPTLTCDRDWDGDGERVCEIREMTVSARNALHIDGGPNGGIRVHGWDGSEIRVFARVEAHASSLDHARSMVEEVAIRTDGTVSATGPDGGRGRWWSVSFEAFVPREMDLDLETVNGGVRIAVVAGRIRFHVTNGGVTLDGLGGDVQGSSTNGGIRLALDGSSWNGTGVDVRTTNGGVSIMVPDGYSAHLETGTRNGGMQFDFPITLQGRLNRDIAVDLGSGGAPIRVKTTNGSVMVKRPEI